MVENVMIKCKGKKKNQKNDGILIVVVSFERVYVVGGCEFCRQRRKRSEANYGEETAKLQEKNEDVGSSK
jgi:hypothetical protein